MPAGLFAFLACLVSCVPGLAQDLPVERAIDKEAILDLTPVRYPTVVEHGSAMIAASPRGVIYRSCDRGETWESIAAGLGTLAWEILYKDSRDSLYVLRMSERDDELNKLMRSTDGGMTWQPVLELTNRDSRIMEIVEDAKGVLYLGEYSNQLPKTPHIYRSRDGARWQLSKCEVSQLGRIWAIPRGHRPIPSAWFADSEDWPSARTTQRHAKQLWLAGGLPGGGSSPV